MFVYNSTIQPSNMFVYTSRSHTQKIGKKKHSEIKLLEKLIRRLLTKTHDLTVILTPIFMIFYMYTPSPYMNTVNDFDLEFEIFTLVDTTKSYVILNESINKLKVLVNLSF